MLKKDHDVREGVTLGKRGGDFPARTPQSQQLSWHCLALAA